MLLRDPITPFYRRFGILIDVAKLIHQIIYKIIPKTSKSHFKYLSNISAYSTRQNSANNLFLSLIFLVLEHNDP